MDRGGRLVEKAVSPSGGRRTALTAERIRFSEALDHYLKGDNYQAEQILEGLLRRNVRDLDARLMLATLLRRDRRFDEATEHLDMLGVLRAARNGNWRFNRSEICWRKREPAAAAGDAGTGILPVHHGQDGRAGLPVHHGQDGLRLPVHHGQEGRATEVASSEKRQDNRKGRSRRPGGSTKAAGESRPSNG